MNGADAIPYAMSKAAVSQLGRGLAVELAPHGASAMTAYFALLETDLIQNGVDADPEVLAILSLTPKYMLKRLAPRAAAEAIAGGLETRAQHVAIPARWRPVAALQGVIGPLADNQLARNAAMQRALTNLDQRGL